MSSENEKHRAAEAAVELVEHGMRVGLGTGSTVARLLPLLAARRLDIGCVSTSQRTERAAIDLGLRTLDFGTVTTVDLAIDGADAVAPDLWLIKGGGAAHTREKLVAAAADRFVVIVDSSKLVDRLRGPVPLELLDFGIASTVSRIGLVSRRDLPRSPDGGVIADWLGDLTDPAAVAVALSSTPGVVEHGLFPPAMVTAVAVGMGTEVEWMHPLEGPRIR